MIELELTQLLAVILCAVALLAGLSVGWDRVRDYRAAKAVRRQTVRCRICGAAYRRDGDQGIQTCPHCESPNRIGRDRRLG